MSLTDGTESRDGKNQAAFFSPDNAGNNKNFHIVFLSVYIYLGITRSQFLQRLDENILLLVCQGKALNVLKNL